MTKRQILIFLIKKQINTIEEIIEENITNYKLKEDNPELYYMNI